MDIVVGKKTFLNGYFIKNILTNQRRRENASKGSLSWSHTTLPRTDSAVFRRVGKVPRSSPLYTPYGLTIESIWQHVFVISIQLIAPTLLQKQNRRQPTKKSSLRNLKEWWYTGERFTLVFPKLNDRCFACLKITMKKANGIIEMGRVRQWEVEQSDWRRQRWVEIGVGSNRFHTNWQTQDPIEEEPNLKPLS